MPAVCGVRPGSLRDRGAYTGSANLVGVGQRSHTSPKRTQGIVTIVSARVVSLRSASNRVALRCRRPTRGAGVWLNLLVGAQAEFQKTRVASRSMGPYNNNFWETATDT